MQFEEKTFNVIKWEGGEIPIIEKGSGKPLILLHGYMCNKQYFASQINYFSKFYRVIAYDLHGFGDNLPMKEAYSLSDYANEFLQVASYCGKPVSVLAHSFGCRVVLKIISQQNKNIIDKAVLCGVAGLKPYFSLKRSAKRFSYKILKPFIKRERLEKIFFSADYKMASGSMKQTFKRVTSEYFDKYLSSIDIPLFLIFGENDDQTPPKICKRFIKKVKDCGVHIMQNCSHFCFAEKPNEFNLIVREFLS